MRIDFDQETEAVYFRLKDSRIVASEEISPGIVYDFDENDTIVGIEILNLSQKNPDSIKNVNFPFTQEEKKLLRDVLGWLTLV
ncbi:MAG: DUF2283 domain-containing protein [Coleofasciculus sp. D1-CHI-01]|uniref:DUF2283 domain-containing protein n=1 Tax=Coleofasciculus sp. D1-CHI-01 TaxID=3068482 RepID=UPI0032FFFBBB